MAYFPESLKNAWEKYDIRVFVLFSLLLQIALILFAPCRRVNPSRALSFLIWSIYLLADWVAVFSLGHLVESTRNVNDNDILAFWAPFLLLHLGGPDTITAFSTEDNELWPRHLIALLFQVGTAMYVFYLSISNNRLLIPTLLMFAVGIIKYSERTYALYRASFDIFRRHSSDSPYFNVSNQSKKAPAVDLVRQSYKLFKECEGAIVEIPKAALMLFPSISLIKDDENLIKIVGYQLGFFYDVLFTKAALIHTRFGYALRAICSSLIAAVFISFFFISKKNRFSEEDVAITYALLGGAICLDALAFVMLVLSNWTIVKLQNSIFDPLISRTLLKLFGRSGWSESIAQYNMLKGCLSQYQSYFTRIANRPSFFGKLDELLCIQRIFNCLGLSLNALEELRNTEFEALTADLPHTLFYSFNLGQLKTFISLRGRGALNRSDRLKNLLYTVETEYGKSIVLWHIATTLCYYTDEITTPKNLRDCTDEMGRKSWNHRRIAKLISDHMMYISVMRPSMVPSVTPQWQNLYGEVCKHYKDLDVLKKMRIEKKEMPLEELQKEACHILMSNFDEVTSHGNALDLIRYDREKAENIDLDARRLAKMVMNLGVSEGWETMMRVWFEILCHAATRCPGSAHAQALTRGGEFLTFVWLFLSNRGLDEEKELEDHRKRRIFWQSGI